MGLTLGSLAAFALGAPADYVHHGSLAVDRALDPAFRKAERHLRHDAGMRRILDDLERSPQITRVVGDAIARDSFEPQTRTIVWNPQMAARFADGGRQSPALLLGHELAHADMDAALQERLGRQTDPRYDNAEERRVIVGAEAHAARTLGETPRHDHRGSFYAVTSSTSR